MNATDNIAISNAVKNDTNPLVQTFQNGQTYLNNLAANTAKMIKCV